MPMVRSTLIVLTCTLGLAGATPAAEIDFERYDVLTGPGKHQTVLTGFLLGGAVADLAVVGDDRRVRIYRFAGGSFSPTVDAVLRDDAAFVDVAEIGGRDRLIVYGDGRLTWFDPESATERELVAVSSDFTPPPRSEIPHVDVTRDLSGDGLDDLVVPDAGGFWIVTQTSDGGFGDPALIVSSAGPGRFYGAGGYRHDPWLQAGIHAIDYDRDGRRDLVTWDQGRFAVHRQDERGRFVPNADSFIVDVALDGGRNTCSWRPEHGFDAFEACFNADHSALTRGDRMEKMVHAFSDLNGDGVADLVVYSLTGRSVFSVRSTYEVHFGSPASDGGTVFASEVGAAIPSDRLQVVAKEHDYDGDGQVDMMLTTVNIGFFKVVGALISRSMSMDVEFYSMQGGDYSDEPNATRRIKLALSREVAGKKAVAYSLVLVGDVNGDGRSDLLLGKGRKELRVFPGVPGPELFAQRPQKIAVAMPKGQEYTWLTDLNRDGKQDVLIHHRSDTEAHRVTLLVAR